MRASSAAPPARTMRRPAPGAASAARAAAGPDGVALATGSIYLIADLLRARGRRAPRVDAVNDDDGPSVPAMIAAVAVIVALVILVFFALGYGFGRLFL